MPITLTIPEGLLSSEAQARAFAGLTDAVLDVAGLTGNAFMTENVIGSINVLPANHVLAAGKPIAAAFVELKLPEIALATEEAKRAFIERRQPMLSSRLRKARSSASISGRISSMRRRVHGALQGRAIAMQIWWVPFRIPHWPDGYSLPRA